MWHDLTAKGFARILTVVYATPIRRGACRLFARFPFQFSSPWPGRLLGLRPQWLQHLGNHVVLEDDQLFLHWQERVLEQRGGSHDAVRSFHLPTSADLNIRALHDWINRYGGEPFPGQPLPPRQPLVPLMERYEAHTRHCRSCAGAHRRLPQLCAAAGVVALLALVAAAWSGPGWGGALALAVSAAAAALRHQGQRWLDGLQRGSGLPPRNRP
jgi:hypothetical protein